MGILLMVLDTTKNEDDCQRKTQTYGVLVKGDSNTGNCDYYDVLIDIVELCAWEIIQL